MVAEVNRAFSDEAAFDRDVGSLTGQDSEAIRGCDGKIAISGISFVPFTSTGRLEGYEPARWY